MICRHTLPLRCGTPVRCNDYCSQMLVQPGCEAPVASFLRCAAGEPVAHWECDEQWGAPSLKDGYCDAQQEALMRCMASGA